MFSTSANFLYDRSILSTILCHRQISRSQHFRCVKVPMKLTWNCERRMQKGRVELGANRRLKVDEWALFVGG